MRRWFTLILILTILYVGWRLYFATQELITTAHMQLNTKDG